MHRKSVRKSIVWLWLLVMALALGGCGKKAEKETDSAKRTTEAAGENDIIAGTDAAEETQPVTAQADAAGKARETEGRQALESQKSEERETEEHLPGGSGSETAEIDEADSEPDMTEEAMADSGETTSVRIDVDPICQYPELSTGCEMTSLAMTLNYLGVETDKCDLADLYLDKGEVGTVDFRKAFEGDPRDEASFGCYAPVVVNTANRYLAAMGSDMVARDITGEELESLYVYLQAGIPVIIWGTADCAEGHFSVTWVVDGEELTWFTPEHCMVLVGYDEQDVWVADPIHGDIRSYEKELFRSAYESLFRQAVVIQ